MINILEACKKIKVKKLIHASSIYANSEQADSMDVVKKLLKIILRDFSKDIILSLLY